MLFNISDNFDSISIKFISIVQKYLKKNQGVVNLRISIKIDNNDMLPPPPQRVEEPLVQWKVKETHVKEKVQDIEVSEVEVKKVGDEIIKRRKPGTRLFKTVVMSSEVEEKIVGLRSRVNVHERLIVGCGVKSVYLNDVEDFYEVEKEKIEETQKNLAQLTDANKELKREISAKEEEINFLKNNKMELEAKLAEERVDRIKLKEEIVTLQDKLIGFKVEKSGLYDEIATLKDEVSKYKNMASTVHSTPDSKVEMRSELRKQEEEIEKKRNMNENLMRSMRLAMEEIERISNPREMMEIMRRNLTEEERATFDESTTESEDEFNVMVSDDD